MKLSAISIAMSRAGMAPFNPASLFRGGVPGVWYDPSDLSTLFQDTAGTIPVTGVEQPVGLMLDKSRGKHANGPRRVNLLANTVFAGAVSGTDATSVQPTGWSKVFWTGGSIDVDNSADDMAITFSTTSGRMVVGSTLSVTEGQVYVCSADIEVLSGSYNPISVIDFTNAGTGAVKQYFINGAPVDFGGAISSGRLVCVLTVGSGTTTTTFRLGSGANSKRTGVIKISRPDVRLAENSSILPNYQRITDSWPGAIPGNHASQATTTARPILSARYNLLSSSANVSAMPWNSTSGAFSFSPTAPYIGSEAYRVTNNGTGIFRFIAHPFTAQVGTYTVSAIVEEDIANPSEYTDLGMLQAPSTTLGRIRIHWPTGTVGTASASPLNARRSLLSAVGPNGGRVFSIQFEIPVTAVGEHRALFYPSSTTQNTTGVILHCVDVRLFVDAALPSFQPVVSQTEYQTEGFPYYLQFDGVDDLMSTAATVDLSSTSELVVMTAVNVPTEQTARATVLELGASYANPGCVGVEAPMFTATSVGMGYRGNGVESARSVSASKDPLGTVVFGGTLDLNAPLAQLRVNSTNKQQSTLSVGPGPFANATLFLGARNGNGQRFKGRLYGAVLCGKRVLSPELNSLEQFIRNKSRAY